ncbi:MAG: ABC transporter permease [Firmicutes bacterium]|nr:ABC transporter permease [Bacillota bacterium]
MEHFGLPKTISAVISLEDAQPVPYEERQREVQMRESVTYLKDAYRRFKANKVAMFCFFVIIALVLFAWAGPLLSPYSYDQQTRGHERMAPNAEHWFGTDSLGRDMLVRTMVGTRVSLLIGLFSALIVLGIGAIYGAVSGFIGGKVDNIMQRIAEVFYSLPPILVIILLQVTVKPYLSKVFPNSRMGASAISIFVAVALIYWVNMARLVRGQVLQLKENEYVLAAVAMGASKTSIIRRHLLPNAIGTIIVTTLFQIPVAIFLEAFLSFVGLGVAAPMASLGSLASDSLNGLQSYPYLLFYPALLISITILAFNQFGDGLRDALDPRLRK